MRTEKKLAARLICLILSAVMCITAGSSAAAHTLPLPFEPDAETSEMLRERIREALRNEETYIAVPDHAKYHIEKNDEMKHLYYDVISEREFYYCYQPTEYSADHVAPKYYTDKDRKRSDENKAELDRLIDEFTADVEEDWCEVRKIKYLHDKLADHLRFRYDGDLSVYTQDSPLLALKKGYATCVGYSRAFALLLENVGIECAISYEYSFGGHVANLVKAEGRWYHVDCSTDDHYSDDTSRLSWYSFLKSDKKWEEMGRRNCPYMGLAETELFDKCLFDEKAKICFDGSVMYRMYHLSDGCHVIGYDTVNAVSREYFSDPDIKAKDIAADEEGVYLILDNGTKRIGRK